MLHVSGSSPDTDEQFYLSTDQPVLVAGGVVSIDSVILRCDVLRRSGERTGVTWIEYREAEVFQRYPGYDPSFEWVFLKWVDAA